MKIIAILAVLLAAATGLDKFWRLDSRSFNAIQQNRASEFSLDVIYGPNNNGWFGTYAYIYTEVGGREIADGAVVATWATIVDSDYFDKSVNLTHEATGDFETAECRVIYKKDRNAAPWQDVDVKTYKGTVSRGFN